ncbi:MAG: hypothetical protein Q4D79_05765 [Propionibacteriaceae bacterium]|nr:hypothetical protein [Propionibacteriaceae bacterium]
MEKRVLDALGEYLYGKATAYDSATEKVLVTIYPDGATITPEEEAGIKAAAQVAAGDTAVSIRFEEDPPPEASD